MNRAAQARGAADLLAGNGFVSDAVSRLYYWIFHSVRAVLLSQGLESASEGTLRLLSFTPLLQDILPRPF